MIAGVVLAAGESTRMGQPKALLPDPEGCPFVVRVVRTLAAAGLGEIVVVTGTQHPAISAALARDVPDLKVRCALNRFPARGQLSSLHVGMDEAITPGTDALMVTLVDVPLVRASTVRAVMDEWRSSRAAIVRPAIGDSHGHPVIFDRRLFAALRHAPLESGAKSVVRAYEDDIVNVAVDDEGCLADVDTPDDYRTLLR